MKTIKILTILCMSAFVLQAQDITNKLGGTATTDTYDVTDSADKVLLRVQGDGKVGIATDSPDEELHIVGNIKMTDGNQADGKVLTSDANGVGSWEPDFDINTWFSGRTYTVDKYELVAVTGGSAIKQFTLSCNDANDIALSAGYSLEYLNLKVMSLKRESSNSFSVLIYNYGPGAGYAHAYCNCLKID